MTYNFMHDFSVGSPLRSYLNYRFVIDWTKGLGHPDTLQMLIEDIDWDEDEVLAYVITTCLTSH